jgi:hypothetical protein
VSDVQATEVHPILKASPETREKIRLQLGTKTDVEVGHATPASLPPSIGMTIPVMNEDWSEHNQAAA